MDINSLRAASAYRQNAKMMQGAEAGTAMVDDAMPKPSFGQMLGDTLSSAIDTQYKTEAVKLDSLTGTGDLGNLVTAVSEAELSLTTVVNLRDRMISAYQEILRMPI